MTCESTLTVWFPNVTEAPTLLPESATKVDKNHIRYWCVRSDGHDGEHGWCQGFDTGFTYRWGR